MQYKTSETNIQLSDYNFHSKRLKKTFNLSDVMNKPFSQLLQEYRKLAGLNQSDVARRVGVSANYISSLERDYSPTAKGGKPTPSVEVVDKIAKAVNAPKNEMRLAAGYAPKNVDLPDEIKIMDFDGLSKNDLKDIAEFIKFKRSQKDNE